MQPSEDDLQLLLFAHKLYLEANGRIVRIVPCDETYEGTTLDRDRYWVASERLVAMNLARWIGTGHAITITQAGVFAAGRMREQR